MSRIAARVARRDYVEITQYFKMLPEEQFEFWKAHVAKQDFGYSNIVELLNSYFKGKQVIVIAD